MAEEKAEQATADLGATALSVSLSAVHVATS
jgi:hypothetical protein